MKKVPTMSDDELLPHVYGTLSQVKKATELHQFHAAKAFNSYIDQLVGECHKKAEQRFEKK